MKKRILSLVLAVLMMFTFNIGASAETTVQPRLDYTVSVIAGLSISSQQATCLGKVTRDASATRVTIKMTLQKKGFLKWSDVTSWTTDAYTEIVAIEKNYGPLDSGTYRVYVVATVYSGSASEIVEAESEKIKVS